MPSGPSPRALHRQGARAYLRTLTGLLVVVLLTASCATTPVPRYQPPAGVTISKTDQNACEAFATAAVMAAPVTNKQLAGAAEMFNPVFIPFLPITLPVVVRVAASEVRRRREADARTQAEAMEVCLAPIVLAQTLGPDDPAVAKSVTVLAGRQQAVGRHAEAEALFQRAIAHYERLAPDTAPAGRVAALEGYARWLREQKRADEATTMDGRAEAIRDVFGPQASLWASPDDLGSVEVGTPSQVVTVHLRNTGRYPIEITQVSTFLWGQKKFLSTPVSCIDATVPPEGTCLIGLTFSPYYVGRHSPVLRVEMRANGLPRVAEVSLRVVGVASPKVDPDRGPTP